MKEKIITFVAFFFTILLCIIFLSCIIWFFLDYPTQENIKQFFFGEYYEFEEDCKGWNGEIKYCKEIPFCFESDGVKIPFPNYGKVYNLGSFGGYFWDALKGKNPEEEEEKDIKNLEEGLKSVNDDIANKMDKWNENINECLKQFSKD